MFSVIVLTKNEEQDLPACLRSVQWSDDIHVLDSGSTDGTFKVAEYFNAQWWHNEFKSFGQQRNFALDNLDIKNEWILFLDADEEVTPEFQEAMFQSIYEATDNVAGFYCCWKTMLDGHWLRRSDNFPKWQLRILRKGMIRFKDFGHGQKEDVVLGDIHYIKSPYLHFAFSKGWSAWLNKHNGYSTLEAESRLSNCPPFKNVFSSTGSIRNVALKAWLSRFPAWPLLRFFFTYVMKMGFLDGRAGLCYCVNICYYEFLIQIKMREIQAAKKINIINIEPLIKIEPMISIDPLMSINE